MKMNTNLDIRLLKGATIDPGTKVAIHLLCNRAYQTNLEPLFATFKGETHVCGYLDELLVSHALWVTRWLQVGAGPLLRTAYVEMVATEPDYQDQGFASQIMRALASAIVDHDLGALCPAETSLYEKLGWIYWQGSLFIRANGKLLSTPEKRVMILPLPRSPFLDIHSPLSAEWREGELW